MGRVTEAAPCEAERREGSRHVGGREREKGPGIYRQGVQTTLGAATARESVGALRRVASGGKHGTIRLPEGWLAVAEALGLPLPNTLWMSEPWTREEFTEWMG